MPGNSAKAARGGLPGCTNSAGVPPSLGGLQQADPVAQRFQRVLRDLLNPVLRRVMMLPVRFTTETLPVASEGLAARMIRVKDSDKSAESVRICLQGSDGSWVWVEIGTTL